jgi:DNA-binding MarR family transcriptional regulator
MLSPQQIAILSLLEARGALCVAVIRTELGLSQDTAAKSIRRLVDRGAVRLNAAKARENALVELMPGLAFGGNASRRPIRYRKGRDDITGGS